MEYKLFWTEEAIRNLVEILDYLVDNWSQKEAVLSKQTTVFYELKGNIIYLAYLFVNRKNIIGIK